MGCGASAGTGAAGAGLVIKTLDTGVLAQNSGNVSMFGGAAMLCDNKATPKVMYLAGNKGMVVMDMTDPADPKKGDVIKTGTITDDSGCAFIQIASTLLLAGGYGLKPIDVSQPTNPKPDDKCIDTGALGWKGGAAMVLKDSTLYVAGGNGLSTFNVTDPKAPTKVGKTMDTEALLSDGGVALCMHGSYLYAVGGKGLATIDISDPQNPKKVGSTLDTGVIPENVTAEESPPYSSGAALAVNGTCLYVLGGRGLQVLDISKPDTPALEGSRIDTGSTTHTSGAALAVLGSKLLTAGGAGLSVFDISDAKAPKKIQTINTGVMSDSGPAGLLVQGLNVGGHTYLAGGSGLAVLDNSKISTLQAA